MEKVEFHGVPSSDQTCTHEANQEAIVMVTFGGPNIESAMVPSSVAPTILSCCAFWLCCIPLGVTGFVFASMFV